MSKAAKSLFVNGIYLVVISLGFLLAPNMPLVMLGFPATTEVWIRIVGMLLLILAYYYIQSARNEVTDFMHYAVHGRASVIVFSVAFVIFGLAQPALIMFGIIDLAFAIWTYWALNNP